MNIERKKRTDIQCLRSLSIFGVLVFHIWPEKFSNGFVGVDIFFVISGYLMSSILHRHETLTTAVTVHFYFRRIHRIVIIYLIFLIFTVLSLSINIYDEDYQQSAQDSVYSGFFLINIQDFFTNLDYFDSVSKFRFFRHCWSLAVELQFYLVVPLIFVFWMNFNRKSKIPVLTTISLLSLIFQISTVSPIVKYEFLLSRIWQFAGGILAEVLFVKKSDFRKFCEILTYFSLITVMVIMFNPVEFNRQAISITVVFCSAILIGLGKNEFSFVTVMEKYPFILNIFISIGDFSYVLYLLHWPIITYQRYWKPSNYEFSIFEGLLLFFSTLSISYVFHHLVENPILKFSNTRIKLFKLLFVLYSVLFVVQNCPLPYSSSNPKHGKDSNFNFGVILNFNEPFILPDTVTITDKLRYANKVYSKECSLEDFPCLATRENYTSLPKYQHHFFCEIDSTVFQPLKDNNSNLTALIFGNSHATCLLPAFSRVGHFGRLILFSFHGCPVPFQTNFTKMNYYCKDGIESFNEIASNIKPDVIFIYSHYFLNRIESLPKGSKTSQKNLQFFSEFQAMLNSLMNFTKAIVINKVNLSFDIEVVPEYIRLKTDEIPESFDLKIDIRNPHNPYSIFDIITSKINCPKCHWIDVKSPFCGENFCYAIDRETDLPFFRDLNHVSTLGIRKIYPNLKTTVDEAVKSLNLDKSIP